MPNTYPLFPTRTAQLLDGVWEFCWLGEDVKIAAVKPHELTYDEVEAVPGVFDTGLQRCNARGVGVYRQQVTCEGGHMRLTIGGLGLLGRVFWDGTGIGESKLPDAEMTCDCETTPGAHDIQVLIDNRFSSEDSPLFPSFADFYGFGGIYRSVTLQKVPAIRIERVAVTTCDLASGRVRLDIATGGQGDGDATFTIGSDAAAPSTCRLDVQSNRTAVERFGINCLKQIRPEVDRMAAWATREGREQKPLLMSESGACGLYDCHDYGRAPWSDAYRRPKRAFETVKEIYRKGAHA